MSIRRLILQNTKESSGECVCLLTMQTAGV